MTQPTWKIVYATDYSVLYEDTTGVYAPELAIAEENGDGTYQVFRFSIDQCALVGGLLVLASIAGRTDLPHPMPSYVEWFAKDLASVASSVGSTREDLIDALCCADAPTRAVAYEAIGGYHGMINFDQYPDTWQNWPPERA
jgi:hypothetical protein